MTSGRPELSSRALNRWAGRAAIGARSSTAPRTAESRTAVATLGGPELEIGIASNQAAMMTAMICSSVPMTLSTVRTARNAFHRAARPRIRPAALTGDDEDHQDRDPDEQTCLPGVDQFHQLGSEQDSGDGARDHADECERRCDGALPVAADSDENRDTDHDEVDPGRACHVVGSSPC